MGVGGAWNNSTKMTELTCSAAGNVFSTNAQYSLAVTGCPSICPSLREPLWISHCGRHTGREPGVLRLPRRGQRRPRDQDVDGRGRGAHAGGQAGFVDGVGAAARFDGPQDLEVRAMGGRHCRPKSSPSAWRKSGFERGVPQPLRGVAVQTHARWRPRRQSSPGKGRSSARSLGAGACLGGTRRKSICRFIGSIRDPEPASTRDTPAASTATRIGPEQAVVARLVPGLWQRG